MKTKIIVALALVLALAGSAIAQQDTGKVNRSGLAADGRIVPKWVTFYSWMVQEQGNLFFTNERVRAALSGVPPLSFNSLTGAFSLTGLSGLGTVNQIPGMNSGATGLEWKTLAGGAQVSVTHGLGTVTIGIVANSIGAPQIGTAAVGNDELGDSVVTSRKVALDQLVRSINGLFDDLYVGGEGGATVRTAAGPVKDSLLINAGAGGGGGSITAIQSTDLDVTNPNGPTTTINIKTSGVTNPKLGPNAVTTDKVLDGTLLSADANASFKAPNATHADSSDKAALAVNATHATAADSAGDVADNVVNTTHIVNGTITTPDFNAAAKAPLAGTADSSIKADHAINADSAGKVKSTGVTATTYGNATSVPQITVNPAGQATAISNVTITGTVPGGSAGGDFTGTFPNPTLKATAITGDKIWSGKQSYQNIVKSLSGRFVAFSPTPATSVTLTTSNEVYVGTNSSPATVTLPAANSESAIGGEVLTLIRGGSSSANITIQRGGSDLINGVTSVVLTAPYDYLELVSDGGTKWYVVGGMVGGDPYPGGPIQLTAYLMSEPDTLLITMPVNFTAAVATYASTNAPLASPIARRKDATHLVIDPQTDLTVDSVQVSILWIPE